MRSQVLYQAAQELLITTAQLADLLFVARPPAAVMLLAIDKVMASG